MRAPSPSRDDSEDDQWDTSRSATAATARATPTPPAGVTVKRSRARPTPNGSYASSRWIERGGWIDPRGADASLAEWVEEFLLLCRRLAPTTQAQYRRDLTKYVVPRFGSYRLGGLPADEIDNWLNDEIAAGIAPSSVHRHYRLIRRMLHVAVEKEKLLRNPCDRVTPPSVPKTEMTRRGTRGPRPAVRRLGSRRTRRWTRVGSRARHGHCRRARSRTASPTGGRCTRRMASSHHHDRLFAASRSIADSAANRRCPTTPSDRHR